MTPIFVADRPADAELIVLPVGKGALAGGAPAVLDDGARRIVTQAAAAGAFEGDAGAIAEAFVPAGDRVERIALLGTGAGTAEDWEAAGGALVARYLTGGPARIAVDLGGVAVEAEAVARFVGTAAQRSWRYDAYRTTMKPRQRVTLETLAIVGAPGGTDAAWAEAAALVAGMELTRELVTLPPNVLYPETFVERVLASVEGTGLSVEVLDAADMEALGMGALLAVAKGSAREPRLLALTWDGGGEDAPRIALVGKGVTFDSGGISIKPAAGMEDMKWDMGGAGAVAGAMKAIALRGARANVVGVMGLAENMPDGMATRPGDVVTSLSGQTVEVINTDAEGRLVLADAITWVQRTHAPATIVDLATLTGAMIVSLGNEYGGLFANDEALAAALLEASSASGDKLWRFPLADTYDRLIDSAIADMKNVGPRGAGSITAAQFLKRYVDAGVAWAHLDIAGMVWSDKDGVHHGKGATGYGVRLLDRFVRDRAG